jgi:hypothetical protein
VNPGLDDFQRGRAAPADDDAVPDRPSHALDRLERLRLTFGRSAARRKLAWLARLNEAAQPDAARVRRLHALLYFMRAYPDDPRVLRRVERLLAGFAEREDLRRFRDALANSGIAGTEVRFPFFWFTLEWIAGRWPDRLRVDWRRFRGRRLDLLDARLGILVPYCETLALEEGDLSTREWVDRLRGPAETDAAFLVRRFRALRADALPREAVFEEMDVPFRLLPGRDTPSTTRSRWRHSPAAFQRHPLVLSRDTFERELWAPARPVRAVHPAAAREVIVLARTLMIARERDLDAFVHADERDVRVLDYPGGFQLVCIGTRPERRQMLDAAYGFLMLRNGVPLGYVLSASLFGSAEVAYNVSPEFRGGETAHLYARCLHAVRQLFGADTFVVDPYQMGHDNREGLESGAWWFYYKLGFRPRDPAIARLAEAEARRARERRGYRSSPTRLDRLSSVNAYLDLGRRRDDVIGEFSRENVGLHIVRRLAAGFGSDRERGLTSCAASVARLLGLQSLARLAPAQRLAWERWSPLVLALPGIETWSAAERAALVRVVCAKGGRRESDFVRLFDRHRRLRRAVFDLSRQPPA